MPIQGRLPHSGGDCLARATTKLAADGRPQGRSPYGAKGPGSSLPGRLLGEEAALLYRAVFHLGAGARDSRRTRQGEQADDDECTLLHDIHSGDDQDPMTPTPPWATPSPRGDYTTKADCQLARGGNDHGREAAVMERHRGLSLRTMKRACAPGWWRPTWPPIR